MTRLASVNFGTFGAGFVQPLVRLRGMYPEAAMKELRPAAKKANFETILFWHRTYLPKHFKANAAAVYKYEPRDFIYNRLKRKRHGHTKPLVWSGDGSAAAMRQIRPAGTSKRARGLMPGTQVFNFGGRANMPPMREEVTRTRANERRKMAQVHGQVVQQTLQKLHFSKTRRI
jgi:hypothetical protein